jgi:hypothetical protein
MAKPAEEEVDEEAPAPRSPLGQRAAEEEPNGRARATERPVDREGLGPLLGVAKGRRERGEGGRREQRAERSLHGTGRDQRRETVCGATERRRDREARQADVERRASPPEVREPPTEEQQRTERKCVRRDQPLPIRQGEVQISLRVGQCNVDDRRVERHHQLGDAEGPECPPPSRW